MHERLAISTWTGPALEWSTRFDAPPSRSCPDHYSRPEFVLVSVALNYALNTGSNPQRDSNPCPGLERAIAPPLPALLHRLAQAARPIRGLVTPARWPTPDLGPDLNVHGRRAAWFAPPRICCGQEGAESVLVQNSRPAYAPSRLGLNIEDRQRLFKETSRTGRSSRSLASPRAPLSGHGWGAPLRSFLVGFAQRRARQALLRSPGRDPACSLPVSGA